MRNDVSNHPSTHNAPLKKSRLGHVLASGIVLIFTISATLYTSSGSVGAEDGGKNEKEGQSYDKALIQERSRLSSARDAVKRGDHKMAAHDYLASIQDDAATADQAIAELGAVFLDKARVCREDGKHVDESATLNHGWQTLQQLKQADASSRFLSEKARLQLFAQLFAVHDRCHMSANVHIAAAEQLRTDAVGKRFWNFNDREKQMAALREVNLAWCFYPAHVSDEMVRKMYAIWADMKSELKEWQYNQVMESDRLTLGRAVGDRQ